jgi:hypothetical protein
MERAERAAAFSPGEEYDLRGANLEEAQLQDCANTARAGFDRLLKLDCSLPVVAAR